MTRPFDDMFAGDPADPAAFLFDEELRVMEQPFVEAVGVFVAMQRRPVRIREIAAVFNATPALALRAIERHPAMNVVSADSLPVDRRFVEVTREERNAA